MRTSLHLTLAALGVAAFNVSAQTSGSPEIQLYAGLTVTAEVGKVYSIEYVPDITQTNDPSAWRRLEYLQLPASPYLWADKSAPATEKRFYRAVAMEAPTNMGFIPPGTFRMGSPTNEVGRDPWARFSYGDDPGYTNLTNYAWYDANSGGTTHPVGEKLPNPSGLYDMHGNVSEWCQDSFDPYPGGIAVDPHGGARSGVYCGGNWAGEAESCRSATRSGIYPGAGDFLFGFRVILAPGQP